MPNFFGRRRIFRNVYRFWSGKRATSHRLSSALCRIDRPKSADWASPAGFWMATEVGGGENNEGWKSLYRAQWRWAPPVVNRIEIRRTRYAKQLGGFLSPLRMQMEKRHRVHPSQNIWRSRSWVGNCMVRRMFDCFRMRPAMDFPLDSRRAACASEWQRWQLTRFRRRLQVRCLGKRRKSPNAHPSLGRSFGFPRRSGLSIWCFWAPPRPPPLVSWTACGFPISTALDF